MTEFRRRIDEFELDFLQSVTERLRVQRLAQRDDALDVTGHAALQHQEVLAHQTVVDETAERRDLLVRQIELCRRVRLVVALADVEDLLVALRSVVITVLHESEHANTL